MKARLLFSIILTWLFAVNATDAFAASPSGMVSDDFDGGTLNTSLWAIYDPVGNSSFSMSGSQIAISVPAGSNHDLWKNALFAPRIRQAANNTDFEIQAKFDSSLTAQYQLHGFTVEQTDTTFNDFIVYTDGSVRRVFSATFENGNPTIRINITIPNDAPYLRVTRVADLWTYAYSFNGNTWTTAGSYTDALTVTKVGIVGGNAPANSPAYTALVDYFLVDGIAPPGNPPPPPPATTSSGMVSDAFDGSSLNTGRWSFFDPVGNCSVSMTGTRVAISVPAGSNHDLWKNALFAPRIRQVSNNTNFEIQAKFDSSLIARYQLHGFTVEQTDTTFNDFIVYTDGSVRRVFSATFENGDPTIRINITIPNDAPYLRVTRVADLWTYAYSFNGNTWITAGSYTDALTVTKVGIVGGNAPANSPAYTALVDYFMVDGIAPGGNSDNSPPIISNIQASATATSATISWDTNELSNSRVDYGASSNYGSNVINANNVTAHNITLPNLTPNTTYHYKVGSTDASGNAGSSLDRVFTTTNTAPPGSAVSWIHLTSKNGDLPVPPTSRGQVEIKVVDLNKDGLQDYVLNMWQQAGTFRDTMVWYQHQPNGSFVRYLIDNEKINLSHSEKFNDIDGDGDLDLIMGQADSGFTIDWWENPYPNYNQNTPWVRRQVYSATTTMYHDGIWGDFDGDGVEEYLSWHQKSRELLLFEKPANPKTSGNWPFTRIFTWSGGGRGYGSEHRYRGVDAIDMNLDGKLDFVGGCGWFEHTGGSNYAQRIIDEAMGYSQIQAGQLVQGGRPEVLCLKELEPGPLNMYQWNGSAWQIKTLVATVSNAHTLQIGDINLDGKQDILFAEMGLWTNSSTPNYPNAGLYVLYGDGNGNFTLQTVFQGQGHLEGQLTDIDNDGDLDIVTKPFRHNMPMVEMWINQTR